MNTLKKYEFILKDLSCPNCADKIQRKISEDERFKNVIINFNTSKLIYESENENKEQIEKIVKSIESGVEIVRVEEKKKDNKTTYQILRLTTGLIAGGIGFFVNLPQGIATICILLSYVILLYRTVKNAINLLIKSKTINENFLITVSCIGAYLVGEHMEGLMVIILYEIGKILEDRAVSKTRESISSLMDIRPEYANLKKGNSIEKVSPETVKIGDIVVIKQGEKIPLDGIVISGNASLDTSSLTGESKVRDIEEGMEVLSGSINIDGIIEIKVTEKYENSTVNKILELVENATDKKAKTETFVAKAARIYTPVVLGLACVVAVVLPLFSDITYNESIYRALIFLVISCPCAIAISVPLSYFSGIGKASKVGILIKGSDYLDNLKDIKEIVFDKTGTLTKGEFKIKKVNSFLDKYSENEVLEYIVLGESFSNHPIAKSILKSADIKVDENRVEDYKEIAGKGISYKIDGKEVLIGNSNLIGYKDEDTDTTVFVKLEEEIIGNVVLSDIIKSDTKEGIRDLNKAGIKTKMFTGDKEKVALSVAEEIGISEVKYEMLPTDKYLEMEKIIESYKGTGKKVAFVGDGINDSPVLTLTDIGISMGGVGSHSAIEASDVVIMTDSVSKVLESIKISKRTYNIIKQNLIFAIGTKLLILALSTVGLAGMWQAIFADVGVTLLTILNSLRILK